MRIGPLDVDFVLHVEVEVGPFVNRTHFLVARRPRLAITATMTL